MAEYSRIYLQVWRRPDRKCLGVAKFKGVLKTNIRTVEDFSVLQPDEGNTYNLKCIPFTLQMMKKFLNGCTSVIIDSDVPSKSAYNTKLRPQRDEFYYIGEPFIRYYGWRDGINAPCKIKYSVDKSYAVLEAGFDKIVGKRCLPQMMKESEARYFIKVKRCSYRIFKKIPLAKTIHDNLYEVTKSRLVLVVDFETVTKDYIAETVRKREREQFIEQWF